jgi:Major Facilitator Superfamily.
MIKRKIESLSEKFRVQLGLSAFFLFIAVPLSIKSGIVPIYMRSVNNYSDSQVGLVVGVASLIAMIFIPVWGTLDDKMNKTSKLLLIMCLVGSITFAILGIVKPFIMFIVVRIIYDVFTCAAWTIIDKTAIQTHEQYDIPYAHTRVLGSIGFSTCLLPILFLVNYFDSYYIAFIFGVVAMLLAALATRLFKPIDQKALAKITDKKEKKQENGNELVTLLKTKPYILLVLIHVLIFSASDVSGAFQGIHLVNTLGANEVAISWVTFVSAGISEVPLFLVATYFYKKFGWKKCLTVAVSCFFIRFIFEGFITSWQLFIVGKLIHGITISMSASPLFMLIKENVPSTVYSRAIAYMVSIKSMLTAVLSILIGQIIDVTGTTFSMYPFFIALTACALLILIYYRKKY